MMTGGASGGFKRIFGCAFAVAAIMLSFELPAEASTRVCRQLEGQLSSLSSGGGGKARRYDAAIARQQEQIRQARDQGRQAGCGRFMSGAAVSFCGILNATLDRMERNLAELNRTRQRMGGGGDTRRERARITAALNANGCRAKKPDPAPQHQAAVDNRTGPARRQSLGPVPHALRTHLRRLFSSRSRGPSHNPPSPATRTHAQPCAPAHKSSFTITARPARSPRIWFLR